MADAGRSTRRRRPAASASSSAPASAAVAASAAPRPPCCCLPSPLAGAIRTTVALSPPARTGESVAPPMPPPLRGEDEGVVV
ncbi:hypothetical protein ABIE09_003160 [Lysobacter enzymogenes]|uniref:hypothetical protein n=1 Tax=Lysobacter enzymogenes TaxID=69 RepID=UPI0011137636|nr:hypothetical protein [Lysobacter enzymogenes]